MQTLLFLLYVIALMTSLVLAIVSRERPTVQVLCAPTGLLALYGLVRRAYAHLTGDLSALQGDWTLVVVWALVAACVGWALRITWRQRCGKPFWGADGQRWVPVWTETPHGRLMVPRPSALLRREHQ